jgi:hypothetical protein
MVLRRQVPEPFVTAADDVAWRQGYYDLDPDDSDFGGDEIWKGYESHLPSAIAALVDHPETLPAKLWANTLVPFVAACLVRTPEFRERFQVRSWTMTKDIPDFDTEANASRIMFLELQRILAPIMSAEWRVLRPGGDLRFIMNDRSWFALRVDGRNAPGFVVPLSPTAAVQITPRFDRVIAVSDGIRWIAAGIDDRILPDHEMEECLRCTAEWATDEIYGLDGPALLALRGSLERNPWTSDMGMLGFPSGPVLMATDFDWHRIATLTKCAPGTVPFPPPVVPSSLIADLSFHPPVFLATDLPGWRSGVHISREAIRLRLFVEAFIVAPDLSGVDALRWATLLDGLVLQFGIARLKDAEDAFYLLPRSPTRTRPVTHLHDAVGIFPDNEYAETL